MISAFGVEHYDISKMSDTQLRHRKRVQAGLSTAGAVVGLSALGAKGVKVGTGKYLKPAAKAVKINTKIDSGVNNALVVGGGIGGAAGLNSAAISRTESKKPHHIRKIDTNAPGSNQHKRQIRIAVPRVSPKQRRHAALATSTGMLAGAGMAAGGNKKKLAVGLIAGGSALSGYAASDPNDYIREKKVAKSAFGVDHISKELTPRQKNMSYEAKMRRVGWLAGRVQGHLHASTEPTLKERLAGEKRGPSMRQHLASAKIHEAVKGVRGMSAAYKTGYAIDRYKLPRKAAATAAVGITTGAVIHRKNKKVSKSAFGVEHIFKAFDPEARRHTQLGVAAGVSGSVAAASGASSLRSANKARGHFRTASGANQTTKGRLLEGLNLKGAAQINHAKKTAVGHGEMLQHIRAGNAAARRARGKAGVALGSAAAAGAIIHHSNNGAANYVGPYQPKAKYAQGAKKTVTQVKRRFS